MGVVSRWKVLEFVTSFAVFLLLRPFLPGDVAIRSLGSYQVEHLLCSSEVLGIVGMDTRGEILGN